MFAWDRFWFGIVFSNTQVRRIFLLPVSARSGFSHILLHLHLLLLQRLTNHRLPSTTHRVVNPPAPWSERSRYSIPFFQHFNADYQIEALASCVTEGGRVADPPITAHAYLQERLCELGLLEDQRGEEHQGDDRSSSRT